MSSVPPLSNTSFTYKVLDKIPNANVKDSAKKVAAYIQDATGFIATGAIFFSMFYVTHSIALQAGFFTAIGLIGLHLSAKYLPDSIQNYVKPITEMKAVDETMLVTIGAAAAIVTGGALFFQVPVSIILANSICFYGARLVEKYA